MSTELFFLTLSAGLCAIMWAPYVLARIKSWGLVNAVGYPDNPPAVPAWSQRAQRAHANMVENLVPFTALVLVAQAAGISTETTALGATLFFWTRVVHTLALILAIPWVRTLAFAASWVGMLLIFLALF
jgi:uncharacterized MAPEG superfamily protein